MLLGIPLVCTTSLHLAGHHFYTVFDNVNILRLYNTHQASRLSLSVVMSSFEALLENGQIHRLFHPNCRWATLLHLNPPVPFEPTPHALGLIYSFYQGLIEQNPRLLHSFLLPLNRPHYA